MPPVNDNFAAAIALDLAGGTMAGTTVAATSEVDEPTWDGMDGVLVRNSPDFTFQSVWYKITATHDIAFTVDPGATAAGLDIAAYRGTTLAGLTMIAANNNTPISFAVFAGQTVYVQLYNMATGTPPGESTTAPQPFTLAWATSPLLKFTVKIDGVTYGPFLYGGRSGGAPLPADHIRDLWFGGFFAGSINEKQIRNIKVGSAGYGSSDLFAPTLADLSEFDSVQGTPGDVSASAGVLTVSNAGADAYAVKDLGADIRYPLFVSYDIKVDASEIATGSVADAVAAAYSDVDWLDSIYAYDPGSGLEWFEESAVDISGLSVLGAGPAADTWVTVEIRWDFGAVLPYVLPLRYHWRFVAVDIPSFAVLTFLDGLASGRYVHRLLDQPWEMGCVVPSDNPEVNIVHSDGLPFVEEGVRFLIGFRREGGSPPWKVRAATIILQTQDRVENDVPYTDVTGWDSWMYLNSRPVVKADGSFPSKKGLSTRNTAEFADAQAATVALTLLSNTIANHGSVYIDAGVAYGGTAFWAGTIETTADVDLNFGQGAMVGDAWSQLVATQELDIVLTPIYDPVNRPGYIAELSIYAEAGSEKPDAIFSWDKFPRSLVDITRLKDGTKRANKIQNFDADGGPATAGTASGSVTTYGEWWASQSYPGQSKAAVSGLTLLQLALRKRGITTVTISPPPVATNDGTPIPLIEYQEGDSARVYASKRLRKAIAGYQRLYALLFDISDDALEQIQLVVSDDAA